MPSGGPGPGWAGLALTLRQTRALASRSSRPDVSELLEDRESGCRGPERSSWQGGRPLLADQSSAPPPRLLHNAGALPGPSQVLDAGNEPHRPHRRRLQGISSRKTKSSAFRQCGGSDSQKLDRAECHDDGLHPERTTCAPSRSCQRHCGLLSPFAVEGHAKIQFEVEKTLIFPYSGSNSPNL